MYSGILRPTSTQLHNLNLILKKIKNNGPLSRADIARTLQCSKSTVTNIIAQLIGYGLVRETGKGSPATGRKSTLLEFNPKTGCVIAVDTRPERVHISAMDLSGEEILAVYLRKGEKKEKSLVRSLIAGIKRIISEAGLRTEDVIAIGIMISGIVDPINGIVKYSALLDWEKPVDLSKPLQEALGIPVYIENDVNALALAEFWIGCAQNSGSIAYIYLDKKIGGAYIDEGGIIQGADFAFAEFGKLLVSGDGGPERLENRLALPALLSRFGIDADEENPSAVIAFLDKSPEMKKRVFDFMIENLSQVISTIVAVLNPTVIILGGFTSFDAPFLESLRKESLALLPKLPSRKVDLVPAGLRGPKEILGAAAIGINKTRFGFLVQG